MFRRRSNIHPPKAFGSSFPSQGISMPSVGDTDGNRLVLDHENVWRSCKAEELRSYGYRRVENLLSYSEDFSNAAWQVAGAGAGNSPVVTANAGVAPDGSNTAARVQFDCVDVGSSSNRSYLRQLETIVIGNAYVGSIYLKAYSASDVGKQLRIVIDGAGGSLAITLTADWQRVTTSATASSTSGALLLETRGTYTTNTTADVLVWGAQLEESTGRTDTTTPSEYVSTNVLSSPYHGANCDGVKYFQTVNGNSVASNVVNEGTGAAISSSTLKGLFCEGAATELSGYSADLANAAWTGTAVVAQDAVGLLGNPNEAFTLTDNNAGSRLWRAKATTIADDSETYYLFARVGYEASPTVYPRIGIFLNGGTGQSQGIVFDKSDGSYALTHGVSGGVVGITRVGDFWHILLSVTNNSTGNTNCDMDISPAFNADGTATQDVAAQGSTVFASCELYKDTWSHSPILTTGGTTKTRSADVEATIDGSAWPDGDVSVEFELTPFFDSTLPAANEGIITPIAANATRFMLFPASTAKTLNLWDGATTVDKSSAWTSAGDTVNVKVRANASSSKMNFSVDGVSAIEATYDGSFNPSGDITLFKSLTLGAAMKNLRIYSEDLGEGWLAS